MVSLDRNSRSMISFFTACVVITTLFVALRLLARWKQRNKLWWDDGFMLVAWALLMAYLALCFEMVNLGSAQLLTAPVPLENVYQIYRIAYPSALMFATINITVKMSIILFYVRVFTIALIKRHAIILSTFCTAWYIGGMCSTIFQCIPIHKAWDRQIEGHCINLEAFILGYEITNVLLDVALIIVPLSLISTLNLRNRQKMLLYGIFALGGFVTIASILRIVYMYKPKNYYDTLVHGPIWSAMTIVAAVICGNLAMLKPVFKISVLPSSLRSWYKSRGSNGSSDVSGDRKAYELRNQYNVIEDPQAKGPNVAQSEVKLNAKDPYPLASFASVTVVDK